MKCLSIFYNFTPYFISSLNFRSFIKESFSTTEEREMPIDQINERENYVEVESVLEDYDIADDSQTLIVKDVLADMNYGDFSVQIEHLENRNHVMQNQKY